MRKIKKINGYLVVRFNDREKREYEGTALGDYGVIDAELYTGNLDIDRSVMEYDNADSLEIAVELARGLESEEDITDEPPTYTIVTETDDTFTEEEVEPKLMVTNWETQLKHQIQSESYPDMNARTAAHELYGFKLALYRLGLLGRDELEAVEDYFTSISSAGRSGFVHVSETIQSDPMTQRVYDLGVALTRDCPQNDCKIFLNIFNMARELDDAIEGMGDYPATILRGALRDRIFEMREMYRRNHAVKEYRDAARDRPTPNDEDPASKEIKGSQSPVKSPDEVGGVTRNGPYHPGKPGPSPYAAGHMGGGRGGMTSLELIKAPTTTAGEIADIISEHCPPVVPANCDRLSCRECWLAWLTTGKPPKEKGPSDEQTAPGEEGLHPNLVEHLRRERQLWSDAKVRLSHLDR